MSSFLKKQTVFNSCDMIVKFEFILLTDLSEISIKNIQPWSSSFTTSDLPVELLSWQFTVSLFVSDLYLNPTHVSSFRQLNEHSVFEKTVWLETISASFNVGTIKEIIQFVSS